MVLFDLWKNMKFNNNNNNDKNEKVTKWIITLRNFQDSYPGNWMTQSMTLYKISLRLIATINAPNSRVERRVSCSVMSQLISSEKQILNSHLFHIIDLDMVFMITYVKCDSNCRFKMCFIKCFCFYCNLQMKHSLRCFLLIVAHAELLMTSLIFTSHQFLFQLFRII